MKFFQSSSIALITALACVCMGCGKSKQPVKTDSKRWVALARGAVDLPGGLIQITAPREGLIESVAVREGEKITKNDVLALQNTDSTRLAIDIAANELSEASAANSLGKVRLENSTRDFHRIEALAASHLASVQDREHARDALAELRAQLTQQDAAVESAKAKLAAATYESSLRTIRSPIDGTVIHVGIQPGETVNNLVVKPIFLLAPAGARIVRAELEENALPDIQVGQKAEIVSEERTETPVTAHVERIGQIFNASIPSVDEPSQRQDRHVVECILTLDSDSTLILGQRVLVRFLPVRK